MTYQETFARAVAEVHGLKRSTVVRWKIMDHIPDKYLGPFGYPAKPLSDEDMAFQDKLLGLVDQGWLKARPLSRMIGHEDKINTLLLARRYPGNPRYTLRHLSVKETEILRKWLTSLESRLASVLYRIERKPNDRAVQAELVAILRLPELSSTNIIKGLTLALESRYWAAVRRRVVAQELMLPVVSALNKLLAFL